MIDAILFVVKAKTDRMLRIMHLTRKEATRSVISKTYNLLLLLELAAAFGVFSPDIQI